MKGILEFDLEDSSERKAHRRATSATDAYLALHEFDNYLRNKLKYEDLPEAVAIALQDVRDEHFRIMSERNVNLEDLE